MRKIILLALVLVITGCANPKTNLMQKQSDVFPKSKCGKCKSPPFYVNGRWLQEERA